MKRILTALALFISCTISAQQSSYSKVSIASPTAASLGKYGDIPVSYHTGVPNINIPVTSVKEGPLSLSVSLSYHASGIKVMEPASWVGTGWSLNAGGVITRSVQGAPDEKFTSTSYDQSKGYFSDYGYHSYETGSCTVINPGGSNSGYFCGQDFNLGRKDGQPDLFFYNFGSYSGKFYFNDDRTPVFVPAQDIRVKYDYVDGAGSIRSFTLITPDGNKYYFGKTAATNDVDPVETTDPYTGDGGFLTGTSISSWYLNKIESADGLSAITLTYEAEEYGVFTLSTYPVSMGDPADRWGIKCVKNITHGVRLKTIQHSNGNIQFNPGAVRQDLSAVAQDMSIDAGTHTAMTLGEIRVNGNDGACNKYLFDYEYFEDNGTPLSQRITYNITTDKKRLRLKEVQQKSCDDATVIPPHVFTYFNEQLPRRLSCGQDHWGFSNGITANQGLIPSYTIDNYNSVYRADRDSRFPEMRGGTLQKITYPTGGSSEMEFEPNRTWVSYTAYNPNLLNSVSAGYDGNQNTQYFNITFTQQVHKFKIVNNASGGNAYINAPGGTISAAPGETIEYVQTFLPGTYSIGVRKADASAGHGCEAFFYDMVPTPVQENRIVGGLRIKSITNRDAVTSLNNVTQYSYVDNAGKSTGILYSRPTYIQYLRNEQLGEVGIGGPYPNNNETPTGCIGMYGGVGGEYIVSPGSIRPMATTQGGHLGYNEVKVSVPGNGYSIYRYYGSNYWDNIIGDIAVRNLMTNSCNASTPSYPEAPQQYEYKRGELKFDGAYKENGQMIRSVDYYPVFEEDKMVTPCVITASVGYTWQNTFYDMKTSHKKQLTTIEHIIVPGQGNMENTTAQYFESPYHHQVTRQTSSNSKGETLETKYKYAQDYLLSCDAISDRHEQYLTDAATYLSQYQSALYSCTPDSWCRNLQLHYYQQNMHNARVNYVNYRRTNFTDANSQFNTCLQNAKSASNSDLKPILELRDKAMNTPIEVTTWKNGKLTGAVFNVYNYNGTLPNFVYPSKTQKINLSAPSVSFTVSTPNTNTLVKDNRYEDEETYTIQNGNPVEFTAKGNQKGAYLWDYNNQCPVAKIENAVQEDIAATSFEADGKGNWTFAGTPAIDASAPTGRKSYSLGSGGISKTINASKAYILSFWKTATGTVTIMGGTPYRTGKTIGNWTYVEYQVTGAVSVSISGTAGIDEIKLYPKNARMNTYTYDVSLGITSESDVNGNILYYEYDAMGRLKLVKDMDKNIIKVMDYQYQKPVTQ